MENNNTILYDKLSEQYAQNANDSLDDNRRIVDRLLPKISKGIALEIGIGVGTMMQVLGEKGFQVEGIDSSLGMITQAQIRNPNATIHCGDFITYNFQGSTFDLVMLQAFIHLFPKNKVVQEILPKLYNILSVDGIIHLTTTQELEDSEGTLTKSDYQGENLERFRSRYTKETFQALLARENGFELINTYFAKDVSGKKNRMGITGRKI